MATAGESRRGQTSSQAIDRAERRDSAVQLRREGLTLRQIAARLGISPATAHEDISRALADIPAESVEELRTVWGERLESATAVVMPQVEAGDLDAVDRLVRLTDRAAKLYGLDAPANIQVQSAQAEVDLDATVDKIMAAAQLAVLNDADQSGDGGGGE